MKNRFCDIIYRCYDNR